MLLSVNSFAMPPEITTRIIEIQNFDGDYFFKIENPDIINPAGCTETEFARAVNPTNSFGRTGSEITSIVERLIKARDNDSTIGVFIGETQCANDGSFLII